MAPEIAQPADDRKDHGIAKASDTTGNTEIGSFCSRCEGIQQRRDQLDQCSSRTEEDPGGHRRKRKKGKNAADHGSCSGEYQDDGLQKLRSSAVNETGQNRLEKGRKKRTETYDETGLQTAEPGRQEISAGKSE